MQRFVVVDFVANYPNTSDAGLVRLVANEAGILLSDTFLVARRDQAAVARELSGLGGIEYVETTAQKEIFVQVQAVRRIVQELRPRLASGESILVVSYSGPALTAALSDGAGQVDTRSFRDFIGTSQQFGGSRAGPRTACPRSFERLDPPPSDTVRWKFDWFCALDVAIELMVKALSAGGHDGENHAMPEQLLRPRMGDIEQKFHGKGASNGTQGMMSELTLAGRARGFIGAVRDRISGTKYFWVLPGALQAAAGKTTITPQPAAIDVHIAPGNRLPRVSIPASSIKGSEPATTNVASVSSESAGPPKDDVRLERSRHFMASLHNANFGPSNNVRGDMYDMIKELVSKNPGITLSHLIRQAKEQASGMGKKTKDGYDYSWRRIGEFVQDLLIRSNACLDKDGKPIGSGIRAKTSPVHTLSNSWQDMADAEIILRLVDLVDDIGEDDHENLAGVLYNGRDQAKCDRIETLLRYLVLDACKLVEVEVGGRLVYRRATPPASGVNGVLKPMVTNRIHETILEVTSGKAITDTGSTSGN